MKSILLFLKSQTKFLLGWICVTILPFYLLCEFVPKVPLAQYFFLIQIICFKMIVFNEKVLEKRLRPIVTKELTKELGKTPSQNEIFKRTRFYINSRDFAFLICGVGIIIMALIYQKF